MSKPSPKTKRGGKPAKPRRPKSEFSDDGLVELRGNIASIHGWLARKIMAVCKRRKITTRQWANELVAKIKEQLDESPAAAKKAKARPVQKVKEGGYTVGKLTGPIDEAALRRALEKFP